jgi:hypothetical protein
VKALGPSFRWDDDIRCFLDPDFRRDDYRLRFAQPEVI